jgi:GH15 family glucan-1,4-alpha-glucosidase
LDRYPSISDHGLIGDLRTAALVATDGTVDFFCCPRFDSPSMFASFLDAERGGYFRIAPAAESYVTKQLYLPSTAMLVTRFMTPDGVGEVVDLRATVCLSEGQSGGVVLESMGGKPRALRPGELDRLSEETAAFWKDWLHISTYTGRWREMVDRSAMTLKLLTYAPTGAPVAAATFGLPEQAGGERNWDYRFTWIRDGSMSMRALTGLGYLEEAAGFGLWMRDRVTENKASDGSGPLKIMYRVDGSSDLTEETLSNFEGWRGSRPVRIGNGAAGQLQQEIPHAGWLALTRLIDWVAGNWDQPDEGIWETRSGRKDFTYGRLQCWVALDRAIRLAERHGRPANIAKWSTERDRLYNQIMDRGWSKKAKAFTQHYTTDVLDSSLLLMPVEGFVAGRDPMWLAALDAMDRELVSDSLVYRYNPAASPDGLHGKEGTFSLCTFLYVYALTRAGRLDDAVLTFEKMHTYGNHLGLYSEEIGPTGEQLGNFPQAFAHLALINAAITLNHHLDVRERQAEPAPARAAGCALRVTACDLSTCPLVQSPPSRAGTGDTGPVGYHAAPAGPVPWADLFTYRRPSSRHHHRAPADSRECDQGRECSRGCDDYERAGGAGVLRECPRCS